MNSIGYYIFAFLVDSWIIAKPTPIIEQESVPMTSFDIIPLFPIMPAVQAGYFRSCQYTIIYHQTSNSDLVILGYMPTFANKMLSKAIIASLMPTLSHNLTCRILYFLIYQGLHTQQNPIFSNTIPALNLIIS